jgi:cation-transporting ATPase E
LGAPEIVLDGNDSADLKASAAGLAATGKRVLALLHTDQALGRDVASPTLPGAAVATALVVLSEHVRPDAAATMHYFTQQGVSLKIISGDSPATVGAVAVSAGIATGASAQDARALAADAAPLADALERYDVFGRVAPHQKRDMIAALQGRGHVVGMTGDGVNDVLALKDADLGVAMGSGTDASRAVAQLVLLDGKFGTLPTVVAEGRRVIANVERTANLFVTKTVYVLLLALAVGVAGAPFPFLPRHLSLVAALTIGIPAFFLALAPNTSRAEPGFLLRLTRFAVPAGSIAAAATLLGYALTRQVDPANLGVARTAATLTLAICGLIILYFLARQTGVPRLLLASMASALAIILAIPSLRVFFALQLPPVRVWAVVAALAAATYGAMSLSARLTAAAADGN